MNDTRKLAALIQGTTRRQMLAGATAAFAGIVTGSRGALARTEEGVSRTAESIHQEPVFNASPSRLYEVLSDANQFDRVMQSGMSLGNKPTQISREEGGPFTLFGGHIVGRHIELVPNERIVQAWRVVTWDPGVYSIARFELTKQGSGTKLVFDHLGFPDGKGQHLAEGWRTNYWEPLKKYLAQSR